ncbi:MAG TPA: hypothetical protein DD435_03975 [Cyanobacteria bacterium UBA8530]|nr:hypothetical protein [Cyanobacteria bacterium UBA8530]
MNRTFAKFSALFLSLLVLGALPATAKIEKKVPSPKPSISPAIVNPELVERIEGAEVNWTKGMIKATGVGIAPERGALSQRRALARRDAYQDAYQSLSEALDPIRVNGDSALRDLLVGDEALKLHLNELVRDAQIGEARLLSDGSVEVALSLPLYGAASLAGTALPLQPSVATASCAFTGVVVDGRGCGAQPALLPSLKNIDGKVLFPIGFDPAAFQTGPVKYFHSPDAAKAAMGKNPLLIKARLSGGATRADLILDEATSKRLLPAKNCLQKGALAIVL